VKELKVTKTETEIHPVEKLRLKWFNSIWLTGEWFQVIWQWQYKKGVCVRWICLVLQRKCAIQLNCRTKHPSRLLLNEYFDLILWCNQGDMHNHRYDLGTTDRKITAWRLDRLMYKVNLTKKDVENWIKFIYVTRNIQSSSFFFWNYTSEAN